MEGVLIIFLPIYISDLALKIKKRARFPVQPQFNVQPARDRPFCRGALGDVMSISLRFRFGAGGASRFSLPA